MAEESNSLNAETMSLRLTPWSTGKAFERIHAERFGATAFNPGYGQARFSPLRLGDGRTIPTLYAGENTAVALMLFGDRVDLEELEVKTASLPAVESETLMVALEDLADEMALVLLTD